MLFPGCNFVYGMGFMVGVLSNYDKPLKTTINLELYCGWLMCSSDGISDYITPWVIQEKRKGRLSSEY